MKRWFAVMLVLCWIFTLSTTAYAEGYEVNNDCSNLETTSQQGHEHCYTDTDTDTHADRDDPAGIGADVVLWQNETNKVTWIEEVLAEYRHDFNNGEDSIYGVVRVNLWQKIKSFFNKEE